ncbi:MAG: hypothetical protein MZV70_42400 [Desulfobacterales bacterium]|nr:hypothetical protein [Desulfobacterales bacterium]
MSAGSTSRSYTSHCRTRRLKGIEHRPQALHHQAVLPVPYRGGDHRR